MPPKLDLQTSSPEDREFATFVEIFLPLALVFLVSLIAARLSFSLAQYPFIPEQIFAALTTPLLSAPAAEVWPGKISNYLLQHGLDYLLISWSFLFYCLSACVASLLLKDVLPRSLRLLSAFLMLTAGGPAALSAELSPLFLQHFIAVVVILSFLRGAITRNLFWFCLSGISSVIFAALFISGPFAGPTTELTHLSTFSLQTSLQSAIGIVSFFTLPLLLVTAASAVIASATLQERFLRRSACVWIVIGLFAVIFTGNIRLCVFFAPAIYLLASYTLRFLILRFLCQPALKQRHSISTHVAVTVFFLAGLWINNSGSLLPSSVVWFEPYLLRHIQELESAARENTELHASQAVVRVFASLGEVARNWQPVLVADKIWIAASPLERRRNALTASSRLAHFNSPTQLLGLTGGDSRLVVTTDSEWKKTLAYFLNLEAYSETIFREGKLRIEQVRAGTLQPLLSVKPSWMTNSLRQSFPNDYLMA